MQSELDTTDTSVPIDLFGINAVGAESGAPGMASGRTIGLLQDTEQEDVWGSWEITWRDVVILDGKNEVVAIYNLSEHNLAVPANYDSLKDRCKFPSSAAAGR